MKIKHAKNLIVLLAFTIILSAFSPSVFAEEALSFQLPVTVTVSGTPPTTDYEYIIILEADNPDYPMPEASKGGKYHLSMPGDSTSKFPKIEFDSLGIYTYKIYQSAETDESYGHDDRVYSLVIYVTNAEDGSGLETTVILYLIGQTEKLDQVVFEPVAKKSPTPKTPEEPEVPTTPKELDHQPKTSDDTELMPYLLLLISGIALLFIFARTKKKIED